MNEIKTEYYRELRCIHCQKLICYEYIFDGRIKFICPRCAEESIFSFKYRKSAKNDIVSSGESKSNISNA